MFPGAPWRTGAHLGKTWRYVDCSLNKQSQFSAQATVRLGVAGESAGST